MQDSWTLKGFLFDTSSTFITTNNIQQSHNSANQTVYILIYAHAYTNVTEICNVAH